MSSDNTSALLDQASAKFAARFGRRPTAAATAPGRVNLIGDHVDYCDGFVLPVALQFKTLVVGDYNGTSTCNILSVTQGGEELEASFPVPVPKPVDVPGWAQYVAGVVHFFPGEVRGFDAVVVSDVPMGSGVSSSAALEVAVATFLEALTGRALEPRAKARACQRAEHEFPAMPCGIMDQYVSAMAKRGHALLIDCQSLESRHIPLELPGLSLVVTDSRVKHRLTGSEYPQRRAQCARAAELRRSLRAAGDEGVEELRRLHAHDDVIKRAAHVVGETRRTEQAAAALAAGDFKKLGELFFESHASLSALMQVSCAEMDALVAAARAAGALGSRMTGGGFGGCTVSLVETERVEEFKEGVRQRFKGSPIFFECRPSDGAHVIKI